MYDLEKQLDSFNEAISRLRANYGKEYFPNEKADMIWEELKSFSPKQIQSVCMSLLAERDFAPNLFHFREKVSLLRERIRQWEREQEREEAFQAMKELQSSENLVGKLKDQLLKKI